MLIGFAQEVDNGEPIGLSCAFFTVTHGFIGSVRLCCVCFPNGFLL